MLEKEILLDNQYIIKENKGQGYTAKVFLVEDRKTKKNYAAKILIGKDEYFDNEKEILELLKDKKVPNIVNIINSGNGPITLGDSSLNRKYLILEYAEKGDLCRYINGLRPLKEIHGKILFKKILTAVQQLHNNGVYHRDLKTKNILLDNKYNPMICDFGFSTNIKSNLKDELGTAHSAAPEIYKHFYDGERVDIFALGVILFNLVTGQYAFEEASPKDNNYRLIMIKMHKQFWKKVSKIINTDISDEFKELYVKMIAFRPLGRPTIEEILKDEWMKEINEKSDKEIEDIESEIYEDFLGREKIIKDSLTNKKTTLKSDKNNEIKEDTKGGSEDENNDFKYNLIPKKFREGKYLEYCNEIIGDLNPVKFMNDLTQKLKDENKNKEREYDCNIEPNEYKLKFKATFKKIIKVENDEEIDENIKQELEKLKLEEKEENEKEEIENEEEEDDEDEDNKRGIFIRDCIIKIELYEYDEKKYLLRYVRKSGELDDFYKLLKYINNGVDEICNSNLKF